MAAVWSGLALVPSLGLIYIRNSVSLPHTIGFFIGKFLLQAEAVNVRNCFRPQKKQVYAPRLDDYKTPPRIPAPDRGKRRELMERFLFEKISSDIAKYEFRPRSPPKYITTTQEHFDVPGFDPEASLQPKFEHSLYSDPIITFWSENKRKVHGVTVPDNPSGNFNSAMRFSKPVEERWDNDPEF